MNASCCADGDPAENRGVVWKSTDGRIWEVHDPIAGFEHATLSEVVSDGSRLLVTGSFAAPLPAEPAVGVPAAWLSDDGLTWERVADPVPFIAEAIDDGFVGALRGFMLTTGDPIVGFMRSTDGVAWERTSPLWAGEVADLVVGADGRLLAAGNLAGGPLSVAPTSEVAPSTSARTARSGRRRSLSCVTHASPPSRPGATHSWR